MKVFIFNLSPHYNTSLALSNKGSVIKDSNIVSPKGWVCKLLAHRAGEINFKYPKAGPNYNLRVNPF